MYARLLCIHSNYTLTTLQLHYNCTQTTLID
nr:MAG TPA: hypothetical protein [Caudoviricetes sp.]